jgi:hypothetical protein
MPLLILNVSNHLIQLGPGIGESTEAFLPIELSSYPLLTIYEIRRSGLDITNKIRKSSIGSLANQDMNMIRHIINCDQLVTLLGNYACDVLLQLIVMGWVDQI